MSGFRRVHPSKVKGDYGSMLADVYRSSRETGEPFHLCMIGLLKQERDLPPQNRKYVDMDYEKRILEQEQRQIKAVLRILRESAHASND